MNAEPDNPSHYQGLYIHIPFCDGKCDYCAFYSIRYEPAIADRFLAALEAELTAAGVPRPVTLFMGGGTPTALSLEQLNRLCALIHRLVERSRLVEWTVEANPGSLTREKLEVLTGAGVNRISLGAQAFDDRVLRRLGRRHSVEDALKAVALVREQGIRNLGLDLMACIPGVSASEWDATVKTALALKPEHLSVYALTPEEGTVVQKQIAAARLIVLSDDEQLERLDRAEALLEEEGYERYEISNYARPGFECRHNVSCWRSEDYAGFGPAASSRLGLRRWTNRPAVEDYIQALARGERPPREEETVTPEQQAVERLVFGLRMKEGVTVGDSASAEVTLGRLENEGLVERGADRWRLTRRGRHLADHVAVELMP
ncbi:MAG: radical SAM family heme chaperone HemW [Lentisphaerae bacterium]|nr:radical SAM family heme chaperone HemW [Lentisphaerota bacterium]